MPSETPSPAGSIHLASADPASPFQALLRFVFRFERSCLILSQMSRSAQVLPPALLHIVLCLVVEFASYKHSLLIGIGGGIFRFIARRSLKITRCVALSIKPFLHVLNPRPQLAGQCFPVVGRSRRTRRIIVLVDVLQAFSQPLQFAFGGDRPSLPHRFLMGVRVRSPVEFLRSVRHLDSPYLKTGQYCRGSPVSVSDRVSFMAM